MQALIDFIRASFNTQEFVPLHAPHFAGNEKKYMTECIDSTSVSSSGRFATQFEQIFADYVGTMNGTSAPHQR